MRRQELHPRTAVINKAQKSQSRKARYDALTWLATMFPKAFDNTISIHPLKIGIVDEVLQHADKAAQSGISKSKLREAVVLFTRRIDYLICLKAREMRIDLEGNPVMLVTEEEAERAASKIKKRIEKCLRNARKLEGSKLANLPIANTIASKNIGNVMNLYSSNDYQMERASMFNADAASISSAKPAAVIIKHKATRQYDPEAVARLKEKLGLSRKAELATE